jgi:outer membrane protein assembly factor BamE
VNPVLLRRLLTCVVAAGLLGSCQSFNNAFPTAKNFGVYKLDVNQGNYITSDQVDKLKVGMNAQGVRLVLGTPLLMDPFHDNRWDYIYEFRRQGTLTERREFRVYFVNDKLARWEGDEMPQSPVVLNRIAAQMAIDEKPQLNRGPFEVIWDWLTNSNKGNGYSGGGTSTPVSPATPTPAAASLSAAPQTPAPATPTATPAATPDPAAVTAPASTPDSPPASIPAPAPDSPPATSPASPPTPAPASETNGASE